MFDVAIIGAGICGCSSAYFLTRAGLNVALIDAEGIAAGGSGAAGAFVSPKFVKSGPVKELSEDAFTFALEFYRENFKHETQFSQLLHFANDNLSNERVAYFKEHTALHQGEIDPRYNALLQPQTKEYEHIVLKECALVDSHGVCQEMAKEATFFKLHVDSIAYDNGSYTMGNIQAKKVVLATGAYRHLFPMPYYEPRAIFGHRITIKTTTQNPLNMHQFVSISKSNEAQELAIGATHDVHYNPLTSKESYDLEAGRSELLANAQKTLKLNDVEVIADFTGLRSASIDHLPLVGSVVNSEKTVEKLPKMLKGRRYKEHEYEYFDNLYLINGVGGYGFVLAPYLAKMLCEAIVDGDTIAPALQPSRFFRRWIKKNYL